MTTLYITIGTVVVIIIIVSMLSKKSESVGIQKGRADNAEGEADIRKKMSEIDAIDDIDSPDQYL